MSIRRARMYGKARASGVSPVPPSNTTGGDRFQPRGCGAQRQLQSPPTWPGSGGWSAVRSTGSLPRNHILNVPLRGRGGVEGPRRSRSEWTASRPKTRRGRPTASPVPESWPLAAPRTRFDGWGRCLIPPRARGASGGCCRREVWSLRRAMPIGAWGKGPSVPPMEGGTLKRFGVRGHRTFRPGGRNVFRPARGRRAGPPSRLASPRPSLGDPGTGVAGQGMGSRVRFVRPAPSGAERSGSGRGAQRSALPCLSFTSVEKEVRK